MTRIIANPTRINMAITAAEPDREIGSVLSANCTKVRREQRPHRLRQHDPAILLPLASPNRDLAALEIDVLDPQFQTLLQTQAGPVQQHHDDAWHARQGINNAAELGGVSTIGTRDGMRARGGTTTSPISRRSTSL